MKLRLATHDDIAQTFKWRNHPQVRQYFFNTKELTFEEHERWFRAKICDHSALLFIAEIEGCACGVLRLDFDESEALINIYLNPEFFGQGQGTELLKEGIQWLRINKPELKYLKAQVLTDNIPSHKAFAKAGFVPYATEYRYIMG